MQTTPICDWITGCHRLREPTKAFEAGRVMKVDRDGVLEWEKLDWEQVKCASSDTSVRFQLDGERLRFSGNFGRFGHKSNIEGIGVVDVVSRIPSLLEPILDDIDWSMFGTVVKEDSAMEWGTRLSRVDLACNYQVSDFAGWCRQLMMRSIGRKRPQAGRYGPMWGYHAKRANWWRAKVYDKASEAEGRQGPVPGATLARFEVQLGGEFLKREGLTTVKAWKAESEGKGMAEIIYGRFAAELMREQASVEDWTVIPSRLRQWAILWRDGEAVRSQMTRATFYRVRKQLLEHGIDIATDSNVAALSKYRRDVSVVNVSALRAA